MQFLEGLTFPLASLVNGIPLSSTQLERIISLFPQHHQSTPQSHALVRLLHIAQRALSPNLQFSLIDALSSILMALVGKIKLEEPLRSFAACNSDMFREYCLRDQDQQLKNAFLNSFGKQPVSHPGIPFQSSIYLQKGEGTANGNPHWLFSRTSLKEYYRIKGTKFKQNTKQLYLFLLADEGLLDLWKKEPLKLLWAELYLFYNKLVLQPYLEQAGIIGSPNESLISWSRPTIQLTISRIRQLEASLSLEDRLLYFIVLSILSRDKKCKELVISSSPLQNAFCSFLKTYNQTPQWYNLMAFLFFNQIAKKNAITQISQQCSRKFKNLLEMPYNLQKTVPFLYFFLTEQEILATIYTNQLDYWRIPLPDELKKKSAYHMVGNGILQLKSLKYVDREFLIKNLFNSKTIENPDIGLSLMNALANYEKQILAFLHNFSTISQVQAQRNYRLFIQTWNSYYQLLETTNLQLAEYSLIEHSSFHSSLKSIFHLPRDNQNAVYNIIMRMASAYRAKWQYQNDHIEIRQKIQDFQQHTLAHLLSMLTNEQCDQFWKEWNEMLKMDPQFVGEVIEENQQ